MFETTKNVNAHYYLLDGGAPARVGKREWLRTARRDMRIPGTPGRQNGMRAYMLYIGSGYVPLAIAVLSWSESDAVQCAEDWLVGVGRADEVAQDAESVAEGNEGQYELTMEDVPYSVVASVLAAEYKR